MRVFITFLLTFLIGPGLYAQQPDILSLLVKDTTIINQAKNGNFLNPALEVAMKSEYRENTTKSFPIRIAIDPGHTATNRKESIIEERYVKGKAGFFYEAELTMATALALKRKLENRGFEVMLTRTPKATAVGKSFTEWRKKTLPLSCVKRWKKRKLPRINTVNLFRPALKTFLIIYFKDRDFIARKELINAFKPDICLVIHYNATEFENKPNAFAPEVDYNYSVAFVPGGFTRQELSLQSQFEDFIKLASTDIVPKSILLSTFIVNELEQKLGAPRLLPEHNPDLWYLKKYSVYTGSPGVFSRNLYLTRAVNSPVCYVESLIQNNKDEIKRLAKRDTRIGPYRISSRVLDVADCYYSGIIKYFMYLGWLKE